MVRTLLKSNILNETIKNKMEKELIERKYEKIGKSLFDQFGPLMTLLNVQKTIKKGRAKAIEFLTTENVTKNGEGHYYTTSVMAAIEKRHIADMEAQKP